jgi:glutathione S-transferase
MIKRSPTHSPITLYGFGPGFGLPEVSPYVMKTEIQLKLAGLAYVKDLSGFDAAPKGKLPYIRDGEAVVADSTFIRAHLERRYDLDLDAGLCTTERSIAWMVERMLEDHLAWTSGYFRWLVPENFAKGPAHFFDDAPDDVRPHLLVQVQEEVRGTYYAQGIARHTPAEIAELGARSLKSLAMLLGDKPYVMGERPSSVDAIALGVLAGILVPFFDSPLRRAAEGFDNLRDYVDRLMAQFYPEHAWTAVARPAAARRPPFAITPLVRVLSA